MANIYQDKFDTYTNGSDLNGQGHWTASAGQYTVNASVNAFSSPNDLFVSGNFNAAYISDLDGNGGDAQTSIYFYLVTGDIGSFVYVYTRVTATPPESGTGYFALFNPGSPLSSSTVRLFRRNSGSSTALGSGAVTFTIATGKWYRLTCYAQGSNIKGELYDASGNVYLTSAGSWGSAGVQAYFQAVTDTSITGQGKAGFEGVNAVDDLRLDNFSYDTVVTSSSSSSSPSSSSSSSSRSSSSSSSAKTRGGGGIFTSGIIQGKISKTGIIQGVF